MPGDCRAAAARVLGEVLSGKSLNQLLPAAADTIADRDRGLLQELCYGTLRQGPRLQALLDLLLDKPMKDRDRDIQGLLLCGLYQIESMRTPDHAAVSSTVQATRSMKKAWARGLVNAVLRRFLRERETLQSRLDEAAANCHPLWLYGQLRQQWPEVMQQVIAANNSRPPMTLRINSRHTDRESYLLRLAEADIAAQPGTLCPQAVYLSEPRDVGQLPGFDEGHVSVQDEGAQLAAPLLDCSPGDRVLDACSAPGGKTCHVLELQPDLGQLVAMDSDPRRLTRVEDNLRRLGLSAELIEGDAGQLPPALEGRRFDRILVDAPCSATGVIRRHPDIKFLRREADITGFAEQQLRILRGLWPLLEAGGHLLYATCSILEQENANVVARFCDESPDCGVSIIDGNWGRDVAVGRQLIPAIEGPDGLFYALLRKRT